MKSYYKNYIERTFYLAKKGEGNVSPNPLVGCVIVKNNKIIGEGFHAYASYEEDIKGSLEIGKLADLVILEKDPRKIDPLSIIDIPIQRTMVGGNWSYES